MNALKQKVEKMEDCNVVFKTKHKKYNVDTLLNNIEKILKCKKLDVIISSTRKEESGMKIREVVTIQQAFTPEFFPHIISCMLDNCYDAITRMRKGEQIC